jgi:hypothetical protein
MEGLASFMYGAVGGGVVATALRVLEQSLVTPWFTSSAEAKRKLILYGRPLYLSCHQFEFRFTHICEQQQENRPSGIQSLQVSTAAAQSVDWFTKEGYYAASSAYVLACVASWISLYQKDVVFLPFKRASMAAEFFGWIERFKIDVSTKTILWYHYIDGIGELLIEEGHDRPMPFSTFSYRLLKDEKFRSYYDQLFQFLCRVGSGDYHDQLRKTVAAVKAIKLFLAEKYVVPTIAAYDHLPSDR